MPRSRVPIKGSIGKSILTGQKQTVVQQTIVQQITKGTTSGVGTVASTIWPLIQQIPTNIVDLAALATPGLVVDTGSHIIARTLAVNAPLTVADPTGAAGNPTISLTTAALTKTDDTNVTLTLGGTPASALVEAVSLTLGWTGQLAVPRGGSGADSLTGYLVGNGTSPFTAVSDIPAADVSGLATVATTGAYSDLTGTPTIPADISGLTYITGNDETADAPNSLQILAGTNITFDTSTPNQLKISASGGGGGGTVDSVVGTTNQIDVDSTDPANPIVSLDSTVTASLSLANSATQPGDLAAIATSGSASDLASGTVPSARLPTASTSVLGAVKVDGTTITISGGVISSTGGGGTPANPTASVGLTVVNGTASTYMRSDAAPPLSQAIAPTWTGTHIFSTATASPSYAVRSFTIVGGLGGVSMAGGAGVPANQGGWRQYVDGTSGSWNLQKINDASSAVKNVLSVTASANVLTGLTVGDATDLATITLNGAVVLNPSTGTFGMHINGVASQFALLVDNTAAAGSSPGLLVRAGGNSSDNSFAVQDRAGSVNFFFVKGNGAISGGGPVAGGLIDMTPDASTFTGTLTGMTTTVNNTCVWSRNGNQVTLVIGAAAGTSNATTFTMTGLPAAIQPARTQQLAVSPSAVFTNAGANVPGGVQVAASSGTVTFTTAAGPWGASLGKGVALAFTVSYLIN